MGVEIGEYSHRPNSPGKVLKQRYGDCKDKSLLLCALARANNMEAYVAFVNSDYNDRITQFNPSPLVFNHAIVTISFGGRTYWIDPTISYQRGDINKLYCPPYGKAMLIKGFQNGLVNVPVSDAGKTTIKEEYELAKNRQDTSYLTVTTFYKGYEADNIRSMLSSGSPDQNEASFLAYYKRAYRDIIMTDTLSITDDEEDNSVVVVEKYAIPDIWKDGGSLALKVSIIASGAYNCFTNIDYTDRKAPLSLNYPTRLNYIVILNMPVDWNLRNIESETIETDLFSYSFTPRASGKMLTFDYRLDIHTDFVPPERAEEYKKYFDRVAYAASMQFSWDGKVVAGTQSDHNIPDIGYVPDRAAPETLVGFNSMLFLVALIAGVLVAFLCFRLNMVTITGRKYQQPAAIGGWLNILAFAMILRPILFIIVLSTHNYFGLSRWEAYWWADTNSAYKTALGFDAIVNVVYFIGSVWLILLFFNRRDILPKVFMFYCGSYLFFTVATGFLYRMAFPAKILPGNYYFAVARAVLTILTWVPYLLTSRRAKETFVLPIPDEVPVDPVLPTAGPEENDISLLPQSTINPYNTSENP